MREVSPGQVQDVEMVDVTSKVRREHVCRVVSLALTVVPDEDQGKHEDEDDRQRQEQSQGD